MVRNHLYDVTIPFLSLKAPFRYVNKTVAQRSGHGLDSTNKIIELYRLIRIQLHLGYSL